MYGQYLRVASFVLILMPAQADTDADTDADADAQTRRLTTATGTPVARVRPQRRLKLGHGCQRYGSEYGVHVNT